METDKRISSKVVHHRHFGCGGAVRRLAPSSGRSDDVLYRIHFTESVSGLTQGDPVKFHGVEVGNVKSMTIDHQIPAVCRSISLCARKRP
jgi:ABC-type transporter Mla subunit MlaD